MKKMGIVVPVLVLFFLISTGGFAQTGGAIKGVVTVAGEGSPLHGVPVRIVELNRSILTGDDGSYEFQQVPAGTYTIAARMDGFRELAVSVNVPRDGTATADLQLRLLGPREEITVTASGREEVAFESFKVVNTLDSVQLAEKANTSIGEVLENQPGVAKRSYGPGPSRPVIRGFDGDRVLILQDGARTGSLSSQSGDHAEPIDPLGLERLEVVKGPSTLLYGSNALGGVVNALTGHDHGHPGLRGYVTAVGASNNAQGAGNAGFEYGRGNFLLWGSGGGQRTGNYQTPMGEIFNSETRLASTAAGFGRFGDRSFVSLGYDFQDARYGIPVGTAPEEEISPDEEIVDLTMRRHNIPIRFGVTDPGLSLDALRVSLTYNQYHHEEINRGEVGTVFDNKQFIYRTVFDQKRGGSFSGSFGLEGWHRDYKTTGEEAIAPPVKSDVVALFGLEEVDMGSVRLQFGGRYEHSRYNPEKLQRRSFNGFSGAAGIQVPLWDGGSFLVNYTHSDRTPSLEELYNNGPHPGNLTFEIGNPDLKLERGDGLDLSLRHSSERARLEGNFYYYNLRDFVFLAPTGEIEDGLHVAEYAQNDSRFVGTEISLDVALHSNVWLNLELDAVDAQLKETNTPLPRIPPLRGRAAVEIGYKGFRVKPALLLANAQRNIFPTETPTAGYALFNMDASYTLAGQHAVHIFSVNSFNLGDRLYRNHLSFIKELAPEIGRGVRFSYTVRFF
ncbi:MAG: TonB-dependent receptor [Acidobacteria bacterium]|nr:TonB-dependent receptor [Acidobacteriota bacterium]